MSPVEKETETVEAKAEVADRGAPPPQVETLVDALFDVGLQWAELGLGEGRRAVERSARTLTRVAQALGDLQKRLHGDDDGRPGIRL